MSGDEGECIQLLVVEMLYEICASRWSFNITLGMTGIFAVAAGGSSNSTTLCSLAAAWSIGVGGNLPVDSAVFLGIYRIGISQPSFVSHFLICRIHSSFTPISVGRFVHLVGIWPTDR